MPKKTKDSAPIEFNELDDHTTTLQDLARDAKTLEIGKDSQGVLSRFVRDCGQLISDIRGTERPFTKDFIDFADARASLEIRFNDLQRVAR